MELSLLQALTAPITFPYKGFKFVIKTIKQEADKQLLNPQNIQEKIVEIEYLYNNNEISEEEYEESKKYLNIKLREFTQQQLSEYNLE